MNHVLDASTSKPHKPKPRLISLSLLTALSGAPLAWLIQLLVSESLVAYACYPAQLPLVAPVWANLAGMLLGIGSVCLGLACLAGYLAISGWQQAGLKAENSQGRFLIKLSLMSSFIFITAIIFNSLALILVPPCHPWS